MAADKRRTLVVGTTRDYIERLRKVRPGRAFFLTDPAVHDLPGAGPPPPDEELVTPLGDAARAAAALAERLDRLGIALDGVACYDCESLLLAAEIAAARRLPFPSRNSVHNCRDKFLSKTLWTARGVPCPRVRRADDEAAVLDFVHRERAPVILKPATLSGSELVFRCDGADEAVAAFRAVREGLSRRGATALNRDGLVDERSVLCEQYVDGDEYSCDFVLDDGGLRVIRVARKLLRDGKPAGTTRAYVVPVAPPAPLTPAALAAGLAAAASALGLERCMAMADFRVSGGEAVFLEITPRPGGDCLPDVIRHAGGPDMLAAQLDFARGLPPTIPPAGHWRRTVGLRVHAEAAGRLRTLRLRPDAAGAEILETSWLRRPGDRIALPPDDYDTWLLGHVVFRPAADIPIAEQIHRVRESVEIEIEREHADG